MLGGRTVTLVIAAALMLASCASEGDKDTRKVRDLAGREVAVPEMVESVIPLGPGALRLVAYLGAVDKVVGIEDMEKRMASTRYFRPYARILDEEFFKLPVVGAGGPGKLPDFESIILCRPDAIAAVSMELSQLKNMQAKTRVPALYLSYGELGVWRKEAQESLMLLGRILGREKRAGDLNMYIESLKKDLKERTESVPQEKRPSVYFGGISFKGSHGLTSTQAGYPPGRMVNARNLADGLGKQGHLFIDREQIMVWNPDVIFIDIGSRAIVEQNFEKSRDFYRLLEAAKSGKAFSLLPYNYYNTNMEIALINAYFIGKCLYPERFRDVDVAEKANEILDTFLGLSAEKEIPAYRGVHFPEEGPMRWK